MTSQFPRVPPRDLNALAMPLTMDDNERIFEFACYEGNYGLRNVLSGARAQETKAEGSGGSR